MYDVSNFKVGRVGRGCLASIEAGRWSTRVLGSVTVTAAK